MTVHQILIDVSGLVQLEPPHAGDSFVEVLRVDNFFTRRNERSGRKQVHLFMLVLIFLEQENKLNALVLVDCIEDNGPLGLDALVRDGNLGCFV